MSPDDRKSVLITGCSPGGIGDALAREFHSRGLRVFATARRLESLDELARMGMETLCLDVGDQASINKTEKEVAQMLSGCGLDILVNNAGRSCIAPATEVDPVEMRETFEINVFGAIAMCQSFMPLLKTARGTIVQIGSIGAIAPWPYGAVYNAAKAALHQYSDTLRIEISPFGVKVIVVVTGAVATQIVQSRPPTLRKDSAYLPILDVMQRNYAHSDDQTMPRETFAASTVKQILRGMGSSTSYRKWIWEGNNSWKIWLLYGGWTWNGFSEWSFSKLFNLAVLREVVKDN